MNSIGKCSTGNLRKYYESIWEMPIKFNNVSSFGAWNFLLFARRNKHLKLQSEKENENIEKNKTFLEFTFECRRLWNIEFSSLVWVDTLVVHLLHIFLSTKVSQKAHDVSANKKKLQASHNELASLEIEKRARDRHKKESIKIANRVTEASRGRDL